MADKSSPVQIEIFGQVYTVNAGTSPGYVERLASFVNEGMNEVSRSSAAVDSVRIAVLAALNIADELFRLREEREGRSERGREADERLRDLSRHATEASRKAEQASEALRASEVKLQASERRAEEMAQQLGELTRRLEGASLRAREGEQRAATLEKRVTELQGQAGEAARSASVFAQTLAEELDAALSGPTV
jgi:cell division protein ZapA (FtsZ GTPase activity inhibitor)